MKYPIQATFEQIMAYRPDDPSTFTPSPIVNAVADALYSTRCIECIDIAIHLHVDARMLSNAIRLDTRMNLKDIIHRYRIAQFDAYVRDHADRKYSVDELAHALGYSSGKSISRFIRTQKGQTVRGQTSIAGPDIHVQIRSELRRKYRNGE